MNTTHWEMTRTELAVERQKRTGDEGAVVVGRGHLQGRESGGGGGVVVTMAVVIIVG